MHDIPEYLRRSVELIQVWMTWATGWVIAYLYKVYYWEPFRKGMLFFNIIFAAYVGWWVGEFLPITVSYRDAIISASGIWSHTIIKLIQEKWVAVVANRILPKNKEDGN